MSGAPAPLRVAQFVETLASGGAESLAVAIAGELAARGHEAHMIVADAGGPLRTRLPANVTLTDLGHPRGRGAGVGPTYALGVYRRLAYSLRANRIEVLQCHLPLANFLGLAVARRGICRVLPTAHNNREFDYGQGGARLRRPLRRWAYGRLLDCSAAMIAVSDRVKEAMVRELGLTGDRTARIVVVRNGIRMPAAVDAGQRERLRGELGLGSGDVLLVGIGRLTPQKNFETLLEALTQVPATSGSWRCLIVGDGELRPALEEQIDRLCLRDRVALVGRRDDVAGLLAAADVFCLPSRFEGLPLALLEAMAAGLPVVAFAIDGVSDVVQDRVQGRLVAPGDTGGLAAGLVELIDDADARRTMGARARDLVVAGYDLAGAVDRLEALYRTLPGAKDQATTC